MNWNSVPFKCMNWNIDYGFKCSNKITQTIKRPLWMKQCLDHHVNLLMIDGLRHHIRE